MKRLVILSSSRGEIEDERLLRLATLMGVSIERVPLQSGRLPALDIPAGSGKCSLAMHALTLHQIRAESKQRAGLQTLLHDGYREVFVYGAADSDETNKALMAETEGAVRGIHLQPTQGVLCTLRRGSKDLCHQLSGQTFPAGRDGVDSAFEVSEGKAVETIITAGEHPIFVRFRATARDIFVCAGRMPDVDKPVKRDTALADEYVSLLPPLIFLRHCFAKTCWHGTEATGRLIIDDPLLKKTYGALDFETLKISMRRFRYGTSVAFIPWNYWRTGSRSANRLLGAHQNLSLCIHGCDHTNREFQIGSEAVLTEKAILGKQRMQEHHRRTGIPFEDVMVFPQGLFSKASVPALRSANYLAAVNSTCFPTDSATNDLAVADLLWPAVTRFNGFPIFKRWYPRSVFEMALDLFLGKPALIVEHHNYFGDGCKAIEELITTLQDIEPGLAWPSLDIQLTRSNLRRNLDDITEVRFFTRRFQLIPRDGDSSRYRLSKFEPVSDAVEGVLVDGKSKALTFADGFLTLQIDPEPKQTTSVEIIYRGAPLTGLRSFGFSHNARVLVRRGLSEFRDNTLSQHKSLLKVAKIVVKKMKATGDA